MVKKGETYQHYKGTVYKIVGIALGQDASSHTLGVEGGQFVVYRAVRGRKLFIRPISDFESFVCTVAGETVQRFKQTGWNKVV